MVHIISSVERLVQKLGLVLDCVSFLGTLLLELCKFLIIFALFHTFILCVHQILPRLYSVGASCASLPFSYLDQTLVLVPCFIWLNQRSKTVGSLFILVKKSTVRFLFILIKKSTSSYSL